MDVHMTPQDTGMARSFWLILSALLIEDDGYSFFHFLISTPKAGNAKNESPRSLPIWVEICGPQGGLAEIAIRRGLGCQPNRK